MQAEQSFFEKLNEKIKNSVMLRMLGIAFLILILLIPSEMVMSILRERKYRQDDVIREVSDIWGRSQTLGGPVITIPYNTIYTDKEGKIIKTKHLFHLLPEELHYSSEIFPETRHRGIFDVMVYKSDNVISGSFPKLDSSLIGNGNIEVLWDKAAINFGLSDLRGIQEEVYINWNNKKMPFNSGVSNENVFKSGIHIPIHFNPKKINDFSINLALNGSQQLDFLPLGKTTTIDLKSPWSSPKFVGAFIPDSYEIKNGFTAHYKQLHLNRNFPQYWSDINHNIYDSAMGVELITPNDNYNKAIRSAKYAEMFIAFTFLVFFFFEVKNKKRIHPIQYILVGLALIINYTLLVSISEHISFNWAYIISAIATIALIGWYVHVILVKKQLTWLLIAILTMLYGFIFVILQLEDWALLVGSIGLFIVLTGVMYFSRKIDWYNLNSK